MNKHIGMGRLTRDPEVRYSPQANGEQLCVARFSLAIDRKFTRKNAENEVNADFFNYTAFGKQAEFIEKYCRQGTKLLIASRVENDNYTNKNGEKVYSVKFVVEEVEFAESKNASGNGTQDAGNAGMANTGNTSKLPDDVPDSNDGFINVPPGLENDLPFK